MKEFRPGGGLRGSTLRCYQALDDFAESIAAAPADVDAIRARELELGPLAELLVLRRQWQSQGRAFRLDTEGDQRCAAVRRVAKPGALSGWHGEGVGAFHIDGGDEAAELAGHEFAMTAGRLASEVGMPADAARLWRGAFAELIGNVNEHAGGGARGIAVYEFRTNAVWIAVADNGQGVVRGYVSSGQGLDALDAATALTWAVADHRSRFSEPGRGTGFSTVMRAMLTLDAALRVRSDDASIETEEPALGVNWVVRDQDYLGGFVVSMCVGWRPSAAG
jgi:anti-sigma regulatory factor (Ser/Thr protein kinase)